MWNSEIIHPFRESGAANWRQPIVITKSYVGRDRLDGFGCFPDSENSNILLIISLTLFLHVLLPKIYYFIKLQVIFRLFVCFFVPKISTCVHLADNQKQSYSLRCSYFLIYAHCIILWNQDQQTTISSVSHIQTVGLEVTPLSMFTKMRRPHIARSALQCWKWIRLFLWVLFLVNRAHL